MNKVRYGYAEYVPVFKALADETRLKIVDMLSCGEMCACDILDYFNITQPTLSYHMKILSDCGIVNARKDGLWMRYSLNITKLKEFQEFVSDISEISNNCTFKKEMCKCDGNPQCK